MIGTQADSKGPSLGTKKETSTAKTKTDAANRMHEKEMMNSCTRRSNETNMIGTITIRLYTQDRFNNAATAVDETHQHDIQLSQYSSHPTVRHPMLQPSMSNVNRIKNVLKEKAIVKEMNMMKQRKHQSKGKGAPSRCRTKSPPEPANLYCLYLLYSFVFIFYFFIALALIFVSYVSVAIIKKK
eukprot:283000_1